MLYSGLLALATYLESCTETRTLLAIATAEVKEWFSALFRLNVGLVEGLGLEGLQGWCGRSSGLGWQVLRAGVAGPQGAEHQDVF